MEPAAAVSAKRATETLGAVGILTLLFFPLASLVIGFILAGKGRPYVGVMLAFAALFSSWVWSMIL